jgi:hypothetical protein
MNFWVANGGGGGPEQRRDSHLLPSINHEATQNVFTQPP